MNEETIACEGLNEFTKGRLVLRQQLICRATVAATVACTLSTRTCQSPSAS